MLQFFSYWRENRVALMLLFIFFSLLSQAGVRADNFYPSQYRLTPKTYKGRVIAPAMSYLGADWLEREDRETTDQPEKVLDALKITPSSIVADIGAGTGYYSLRLAKRVGPRGRVLATDIQPEMLARLRV